MSSDPRSLVALPNGRLPRLLLGLCRRGPTHQPVEIDDGIALYRWRGLDGDEGEVQLRTPAHPSYSEDDALATAALERAPVADRAFAELAALLVRLREADGDEGRWTWQRTIDILHEKPRSERHNDPLQGWLALLEQGLWRLGPALIPPRSEAKKPRAARPRSVTDDPVWLARLERRGSCGTPDSDRCRCPKTVHLHPRFAAALNESTTEVPIETLTMAHPGDPNPEGTLPARATRARTRIAAVLLSGRSSSDALKLDDVVAYAGIDTQPVARRRHLLSWGLALREEVCDAVAAVGRTVRRVVDDAASVLRSVVDLATPAPAGGPAGPVPSRAPPR